MMMILHSVLDQEAANKHAKSRHGGAKPLWLDATTNF